MKILVAASRLGPAAVFLPDGSHAAVPAGDELIAPLLAQAAARGTRVTFEQHAAQLAAGPPYAGRWTLADVPDGTSAQQALYAARYQAASENITR